MSSLFSRSGHFSYSAELEDDDDILNQFNFEAAKTTIGDVSGAETEVGQPTTERQQLKMRTKASIAGVFDEQNPQSPYGVQIYDLLETIKKRKSSADTKTPSITQSQPPPRKKARVHNSVLLCEKYRPQQFFDLVGNDDGNRHVLRWLSRWRSIVMGTEPELSEYTDTLGRPRRKVLLVNGPPGSGKTSAAHAIAKQAGYDLLEINASDERNAAVVNDRITAAVESHQATSKRPICIIADEIEGASEHGFIRALVNILKADERALAGIDSNQLHSKKKKKVHRLLRRPIIAICNDVWAPNLHALRQFAEIVHFQRHAPGRLIHRLESICKDEGLDFSPRALSRVADACDFDMRACLNALQFGARYDFDNDRESFELTDWTALAKMQFQAKQPASFQQLESCTDLDKLVASCFTAYPSSSYIDDMMKKPAALGEFLDLADHRGSTAEIKAMVAHSFGYLFRSPRLSVTKAKVPLLGGKVFAKPPSQFEAVKQTKSLVEQVLRNSGPAVRRSTSHYTALTELLPYGLKLACPGGTNIGTKESKDRLANLASGLKELGIGLKAERLENGATVHKLDPPVECITLFDEESRELASLWKPLPRGQLAISLGELQRRDLAASAAGRSSAGGASSALEALNAPSAVEASLRVRKHGFFSQGLEMPAAQSDHPAETKTPKVWIQYSEGFSNAVRKPISWNELFGL